MHTKWRYNEDCVLSYNCEFVISLTDIEFEFSENVYNVVEGGPGFVLVCVDLINGFIAVDTPITLTTNDISANGELVVTLFP